MAVATKDLPREFIVTFLGELGLQDDLIGEKMLISAVARVYRHPEHYDKKITKVLYPELASEFNVQLTCVERDMRLSLEKAWTHHYSDLQYQLYGSTISKKTGKPTNAKFIWHTVKMLKDKLD